MRNFMWSEVSDVRAWMRIRTRIFSLYIVVISREREIRYDFSSDDRSEMETEYEGWTTRQDMNEYFYSEPHLDVT